MRLEIMKLAQSSCLSLRRDLMSLRNLRIITSKSLILNQSKTVLHFIYMHIHVHVPMYTSGSPTKHASSKHDS